MTLLKKMDMPKINEDTRNDSGPLLGQPGRFQFMELPTELRVMIYKELLDRERNDRKVHVQILATCKAINQEADPILYHHLAIDIGLSTFNRVVKSDLGNFRVSETLWEYVRYLQSKLPMLEKFEEITIILPTPGTQGGYDNLDIPAEIQVGCDLDLPLVTMLYIMGALLEDSALRNCTILQPPAHPDVVPLAEPMTEIPEDYEWRPSMVLLSPSISITCSGHLAPLTKSLDDYWQKEGSALATLRKNSIRSLLEIESEVESLTRLLERKKIGPEKLGVLKIAKWTLRAPQAAYSLRGRLWEKRSEEFLQLNKVAVNLQAYMNNAKMEELRKLAMG